jgi:hypothetical protein
MRIIWLALGYLLSVVILVFLGYSTWFVIVWGFNPVVLFPLYVLELTFFGGVVLAHRLSRPRSQKGPPGNFKRDQ